MEYGGVVVEQNYCNDRCRAIAERQFKKEKKMDDYNNRRRQCIDDRLYPEAFWDHVAPIKQQVDALKRAVNTESCVFVEGMTGRGKSYLARMILQYEMYQGYRAAFETASNLFNGAKRYEHLQYVPVLCIDDIDKAAYGHYTASLLHDCLTLRENRKYRTIVTSEINIKQVAKKIMDSTNGAFGQSTLARLDACGRRLDLKLEGDNLRRTK